MRSEDFFISSLKNDSIIVYINASLFPESSPLSFIEPSKQNNIITRINEMRKFCFGNFVDDIVLDRISTLVLYVKLGDKKNDFLELYKQNIDEAFLVLTSNTKKILANLRYQRYENHIEIYDVCTDGKWRRKGIMSTLFQDLNENVYYEFFWLQVLFENFYRDEAINLYLKSGFKFTKITYSSPSGKNFDFPSIEMVNFRDIPYIPKNLTTVKREIFSDLNGLKCDFNVIFSWKEMSNVQKKFYKENSERSGVFNVVKYNKDIFLQPNINPFEIKIGKEDTLTVETARSTFNWHTHPWKCYSILGCYILWPSGPDMKNIYTEYPYGTLMHTLFTHEGVYIIKLTSEMMKFIYVIGKNNIWFRNFAELIYLRFTYYEKFREIQSSKERLDCLKNQNSINCLFYSGKDRDENISRFLETANNYNINDYLLSDEEEKYFENFNKEIKSINYYTYEAADYYQKFTNSQIDFPVFEVKFYSSEYISENINETETILLNTIRSPNNSFC